LAGAAMAFATIIMTASRGAFVGFAAVGLALIVFLPGVSAVLRLGVVAVAPIGMLVFAPARYWDAMSTIQPPAEDYNWDAATGRVEIAKRGLGYMASYPLFGIGFDNFSWAEITISPLARRYADTRLGLKMSAPHNSWIQAGAETGVTGLALWAA